MPRTAEDPLRRESRLLKKLSTAPSADQVHRFRTTARRIEALLATVFDKLPKNERKLLKQLKRVRRHAGRVRDLDVQIGNLQELHLGREDNCKQQVLRYLRERRRKAMRRLLEVLDRPTIVRLQKRLQRAAKHVSEAAPDNSNRQKRADARELAARRLQKLQDELPISEKNLHEYRLRCKRLRYTLELSADSDAPHLIAQLKNIQDVVGNWHDSVVLLATAESVVNHDGSCPLLAALRNVGKAQLWQGLQVTRNTLTSLTTSPMRKPVQRKAVPALASAASA
jgi:CHAD domain-containing protein